VKKEQGTLFIVSGPSGVGKTTVVTDFLRRYGKEYGVDRSVTYTTKVPRSTEVDGVDYHFITVSEFEQKVEEGFFLEWSGEYGAYYGTPVSVIDDLAVGKSCILVIDRLGAGQIIKKYPHTILIWVQVSSMLLLENRLKSRRTESFEQVQVRLLLAQKEIDQELESPLYRYYVVNDELKVAVQRIFVVISGFCVRVVKNII